MNFDYNEEQQLLADSVRRFLQKDYDFEARKRILSSAEGWSPAVWSRFADMGLTGLPFPAESGGFGGSAVDLMSVMEAFGEALVVEPYLPTIMGGLLLGSGHPLLPQVIEGRLRLAFAHTEREVLGAPIAEKLVVRADGELLLVDRRDVQLKSYTTLDGMRAADIVPHAVRGERLPGGNALIDEVLDFGCALVCAEAVGVMKFACDTTLEYLKTRKQFGVPIGTFQALQHRIVDMYIDYEQARSMACLASSKARAGNPRERARAVSAAKIKISDAARHISQESVQLHGGMGMSEEMKVSHAFRRLTMIAQQFGTADYHLARFASL
jgi:alkylation response protein AidB-like acyl-CoA dehydrogenase